MCLSLELVLVLGLVLGFVLVLYSAGQEYCRLILLVVAFVI